MQWTTSRSGKERVKIAFGPQTNIAFGPKTKSCCRARQFFLSVSFSSLFLFWLAEERAGRSRFAKGKHRHTHKKKKKKKKTVVISVCIRLMLGGGDWKPSLFKWEIQHLLKSMGFDAGSRLGGVDEKSPPLSPDQPRWAPPAVLSGDSWPFRYAKFLWVTSRSWENPHSVHLSCLQVDECRWKKIDQTISTGMDKCKSTAVANSRKARTRSFRFALFKSKYNIHLAFVIIGWYLAHDIALGKKLRCFFFVWSSCQFLSLSEKKKGMSLIWWNDPDKRELILE